MSRKHAVAVACGLIALALSGLAVVKAAAARGGGVSSLVGITATEPLAPVAREHDAAFTYSADHLDGAYFYTIAVDPLARGREHTLIDVPSYRFGHPGYGWLAWILTAGRASAVPNALLLIGLVSMFVAGFAASVLAKELGWSPWAGLFVALNPGLIFATMAYNSEPLAVAILVLSLLAWMRGRLGWGAFGFAVLCLIKEQFVLVPIGIFLWELTRSHADEGRESHPWWLTRGAMLAVGPAALALWFLYLKGVFGEWPFQQQPLLQSPVTFPMRGYLDTLSKAASMHAGAVEHSQLGGAALPLLIVVGAALIIGIVRAWRFSSPADPVYILLTILLFSLTWVQLLYPKDLMRIAAVQLVLLPAALAGTRAPPATPRIEP